MRSVLEAALGDLQLLGFALSSVIRRDHQPSRSPRSGSGLPVPWKELRWHSRISPFSRSKVFGSAACQWR